MQKLFDFFEKYSLLITIFLSTLIFGALFYYLSNVGIWNYLKKEDTIIEGILVSPGFQISKISPVLTSNVSIEKDLSNLIFEPLFKVQQDGSVVDVLANSQTMSDDRKEISVELKSQVLWSDGEMFTTDDVVSTFQVVKDLNDESSASQAMQTMTIEKVDDTHLKFKLTNTLPTFFEDMSIGILPKHILDSDSPQRFIFHKINKETPIGTGPFVFVSSDDKGVKLTKNIHYREEVGVSNYYFKFFNSEIDIANALKNGQIHLSSSLTPKSVNFDNYSFLSENYSNALLKRYWALYFNLGSTDNIAPEDLAYLNRVKDKNIRKAIALAVDRSHILSLLSKNSASMSRAIPDSSFVNSDQQPFEANYQDATKILEDDGWKVNEETGYRSKDDQELDIRISFLDNAEKWSVVNELVDQMKIIGVRLVPKANTASDLANSVVKNKRFDMLFYGIETYIDPDISRLWHSSQISADGLNFSSYKSVDTVKDPFTGKDIAKSDDLIIRGRNATNLDDRKKSYKAFEQLISEDVPAIFLFHPSSYLVYNKALKNIDISNITTPEDRFYNAYKLKLQ